MSLPSPRTDSDPVHFMKIAGQGAGLATHEELWRWLQGDVQQWLSHEAMLIGWGVDFLLLLLVAQVLHAATFGAYHAASVGMVHEFFQGRHQSKGQALLGSLTFGAGNMLGGLASGPIWQHYGASVLYSCSATMALLGLLLMLWQLNRVRSV